MYFTDGIEGLYEKLRTRRPHFLTTAQQEKLITFIKKNACKQDGGLLIGSDVLAYIKQEFNQNCHSDY